jgi:hypothetical protein
MTGACIADPSANKRRRSPSRYSLHAGKIPARVIEYLVSYGAGTEKASHVICDDLEIDPAQFERSVATAVRRGVLVKRLLDGRNVWSVRSKAVAVEARAA